MTCREIAEKLGSLIRSERRITNEVLQMIVIALDRRAYLELGYPSMFEWLVKGFGYSNAAAYRRIEAAKLLRAVPDVSNKLESGAVNLSSVSRTQTVLKAQEKLAGRRISQREKAEVLQKIEGQDFRSTEQTLLSLFPGAAKCVTQDRKVVVDGDSVRHSMTLPNAAEADLQRAREILSHKMPGAADSQIVAFALRFLVERLDPLKKKLTRTASESEATCVKKPISNSVRASDRHRTVQEANASCTFRDPISSKICGSRYQIQIDHIVPRALGGSNEPHNLRIRCREHNLLEAQRLLGESHMKRFRRPN